MKGSGKVLFEWEGVRPSHTHTNDRADDNYRYCNHTKVAFKNVFLSSTSVTKKGCGSKEMNDLKELVTAALLELILARWASAEWAIRVPVALFLWASGKGKPASPTLCPVRRGSGQIE